MTQEWIPKQRARTTAEGIAVLRAVGTFEPDDRVRCKDDWAIRFLDRQRDSYPANAEVATKLKAFTERAYPGSYYYPIARTACIDEIVRQRLAEGVKQVVILGAGYDSRPQRFGRDSDAVFVEVDLPELQAAKREMVAQYEIAPRSNLHYVPADLASDRLHDVLAGVLDGRERCLFLCEGLTYYLPEGSVRQLLVDVAQLSGPGSELVFDYLVAAMLDGSADFYGARQATARVREANEPFRFGIDDHALPRLLEETGFRLAAHYGPEDLESRYLTSSQGQRVGRVFGFMRLAVARATEASAC